MLVAFDTVFEQCSVAVLVDNKIIYSQTLDGARQQTQLILPMLETALQAVGAVPADVKAWAFNRGPGAFSGIRINTAVVQALSVANGTPCIEVSSLEALAYLALSRQAFTDGTHIASAIDARQNQLYVGQFTVVNQAITPLGANHEYLLDYHSQLSADVLVGHNVVELISSQAQYIDLLPDATQIAQLAYPRFLKGETVAAKSALPVYLRNHAWKTLAQQRKS